MNVLWYIIIGIIIGILIGIILYFIMGFFNGDNMTNTSHDVQSYLSEMIRLQNKQIALTSNIYDNIIDNAELKNVADFIMQNIPPTTKIMEGMQLVA